jgi:hypothetical protein
MSEHDLSLNDINALWRRADWVKELTGELYDNGMSWGTPDELLDLITKLDTTAADLISMLEDLRGQ